MHGIRALGLLSLAAVAAPAQLKWEGCDDIGPNSAEIKKTIIVGRNSSGATPGVTAVDNTFKEPIKLAVAKNGDVYWVERAGVVKVYKAATATVTTVGTLEVFFGGAGGLRHPSGSVSNNEFGIHGIVLDPAFEANRFVYLNYAPKTERDSALYVSRFRLNGDVLDKASEKVVLRIPQQRRWCCHTGGAMEFDLDGNLYVTVGNNTRNIDGEPAEAYLKESEPDADDQGHAGNTNDLRGKILRIKPTAEGTYTIPKGNLYPEGTAGTRPEVWAMGMRNPYSLGLDKYRNWVAWGDVGPDEGGMHEEFNLFTRPGNAGWPYFVGTGAWRPALNKDPNAPANNSRNNTGLKVLPPAVPAIIAYRQSTAMSGPFYYYDGANASTRKFPPHFNKKWFIADWKVGWLDVVTLDDEGKIASRMNLLPAQTLSGPISFQFGPDGALYIAEYGFTYFGVLESTRIRRLDYTGSCRPATPLLPTGPSALGGRDPAARGALLGHVAPGARREVALPQGVRGFRLYDIRGRLVWEYRATGREAGRVAVPASVPAAGLLRVKYLPEGSRGQI